MCVRCCSTLKALSSTGEKLQQLSLSLQLSSQLAGTDWEREAERGSLDPGKWGERAGRDIEAIGRAIVAKGEELASLRGTLSEELSKEQTLQNQLSQLSLEVSALENRATESERNHARELAACRQRDSTRLREMEVAQKRVNEHRARLEKQLTQVEKERDGLVASSTDIGQYNTAQSE